MILLLVPFLAAVVSLCFVLSSSFLPDEPSQAPQVVAAALPDYVFTVSGDDITGLV